MDKKPLSIDELFKVADVLAEAGKMLSKDKKKITFPMGNPIGEVTEIKEVDGELRFKGKLNDEGIDFFNKIEEAQKNNKGYAIIVDDPETGNIDPTIKETYDKIIKKRLKKDD